VLFLFLTLVFNFIAKAPVTTVAEKVAWRSMLIVVKFWGIDELVSIH